MTPPLSPDELDELLACYALDALDEDERALVEECAARVPTRPTAHRRIRDRGGVRGRPVRPARERVGAPGRGRIPPGCSSSGLSTWPGSAPAVRDMGSCWPERRCLPCWSGSARRVGHPGRRVVADDAARRHGVPGSTPGRRTLGDAHRQRRPRRGLGGRPPQRCRLPDQPSRTDSCRTDLSALGDGRQRRDDLVGVSRRTSCCRGVQCRGRRRRFVITDERAPGVAISQRPPIAVGVVTSAYGGAPSDLASGRLRDASSRRSTRMD